MVLLRRVLYWEAAVLALLGLVLVVAPGIVFVDLLGQAPAPDGGWMRVAGVQSLGLAMLMVLVGQSVEDRWWWAWAFDLVFAGIGTIGVLNAITGVPDGGTATSWWLLGGLGLLFAGALVWALGRAGIERPPDLKSEE